MAEGLEGSRSKRVEPEREGRASPGRRRILDKGGSSRAGKGNLEGMLLDEQRRVSKPAKDWTSNSNGEEPGGAHSRVVERNSSLRKVKAHGIPA